DAADFLADLTEQRDLALARQAIAQVIAAEDYLEAPEASQAIAAAEAIAAALGRPTAAGLAEEDLMSWIAKVKPTTDPSLASEAARALDRILGPDSELLELWEESDELDDWRAGVVTLRAQ